MQLPSPRKHQLGGGVVLFFVKAFRHVFFAKVFWLFLTLIAEKHPKSAINVKSREKNAKFLSICLGKVFDMETHLKLTLIKYTLGSVTLFLRGPGGCYGDVFDD
jgi:hypothetical protein